MQVGKLSLEEEQVIVYKGTEKPFSGKYNDFKDDGIFTCKRCGTSLFRSKDKFDSNTGWPSFDDAIKENIEEIKEQNTKRTEVVCKKCKAHLGHVFLNEGFTDKNTRYCINSISLDFIREKIQTAYFAGGCFWGVEYFFRKLSGVVGITCGYMGGDVKNPSYEQVCYEDTNHYEVVRVDYNPKQCSFEKLAKYFFEIHDPEQANGQGPDIGKQYQSAIFVETKEEEQIVTNLIAILKKQGINVQTKIFHSCVFYEAENYHQNYYNKRAKKPYCHSYTPRFLE